VLGGFADYRYLLLARQGYRQGLMGLVDP